jgi:hypothetical protein
MYFSFPSLNMYVFSFLCIKYLILKFPLAMCLLVLVLECIPPSLKPFDFHYINFKNTCC